MITPLCVQRFRFFCTNNSKSLRSSCQAIVLNHVFPLFVSTFVAMLQENTSLQNLTVRGRQSEEYFVLATALQQNKLRSSPSLAAQPAGPTMKHLAPQDKLPKSRNPEEANVV
jgi:hypothetical protein